MKQVIASSLLPKSIVNKLLQEYSINCIVGFKNPLINNETAFHPDMMFYKLKTDKLLTATCINKIHILDTICNFEYSERQPKDGYPDDCIFNCFYTNKYLICGKSVAVEIERDALEAGLEVIKVNQGYCACSTIKLSDEAFISSDSGIVKALQITGHDVLSVENNGVLLNGYNNGFIGGCALSYEDKVLFTGNIENHKDYKDIKAFADNHGKTVISLAETVLYDYGGFIML